MPNFKIKEGQAIRIQTGSRKKGDKKTVVHKGGKSVSLTYEQADTHRSILELSDAENAAIDKHLAAKVEGDSEPEEKKK